MDWHAGGWSAQHGVALRGEVDGRSGCFSVAVHVLFSPWLLAAYAIFGLDQVPAALLPP